MFGYFKKYFIILLFVVLLLSVVLPVSAALVPCSGTGSDGLPKCTPCHFYMLLSNIFNFIVYWIMAPLAGLFFLVGGIMMIIAGGSEERYKKGKSIFVNTAIGVVIVLIAWAIVNMLFVTLASSVNGFNPKNWWQGLSC